ncbi:hypothetical protein SVTN_29375 [Streptomyces vietnamensis]|uniref:Uncharacterized protein n=2 Tax=Streptomyces vietnamensis TaxID=362257 RepID=A0A0B5IBP9_9ACTN|nr:hypothetical protein SVTN_29375 [Streptomyces vietnamensis]
MLWVGSAAFPLHNIARVEAYKEQLGAGEVLVQLLKWLFVAVLLYAGVNYASGGEAHIGDGNPVLLVLLVVLVGFAVKDLFQSKPVLAIDTTGGSTVIVTLPNMDQLQQIAGQIVNAIDNPAAEFATVVEQHNTTNHFGPVVNMHGGRKNRGISW